MIDGIVDLIIREALKRGGKLETKVCEVNVEVTLKVIEIVADHLEGERDVEGKNKPGEVLVRLVACRAHTSLSSPG